MYILEEMEPAAVLRHFEDICSIPHGSKNTKKISDHIKAFAEAHGLRCIQDEVNNLIIFKGGSSGRENEEPVILQGHIDMVCEKESDCDIDFMTDGLRLVLKDGILTADGTTLGGDDGIAVAYCMAILESDSISHPPLEVIFTVDEEIGMDGARALDPSPLKGRRLINLDSEEEGHLLVGCAGGATAALRIPYKTVPADSTSVPVRIHLTGFMGGHSGMEIDKGRANPNIMMGRLLYLLQKEYPISLIEISGGQKDNAIPRECTALITLNSNCLEDSFIASVNKCAAAFKSEYSKTDPDISVNTEFPTDYKPSFVIDEAGTRKIISGLLLTPNGVQAMCQDFPTLVETSLNLGILKTVADAVIMSYCLRSSVNTKKAELMFKLECLAVQLGASISFSGSYPAWQYREDSPLRETMISVYEEMYGEQPIVESMHAGVECGLFEGMIDGLDAVSIGPDMADVHTPQESLDLASVKRTWDYLLRLLEKL
ncbi:MAG: aminoacyl-histidine dipeptidase [Eubacterium sp.]|nr:aminoacyl-histidine dipeptidase [Eubacterium sp.]